MNVRMNVDARLEPLCPHAAGYQPAELDLRRSLDSHPAASNVIVSTHEKIKTQDSQIHLSWDHAASGGRRKDSNPGQDVCGVIAHVPLRERAMAQNTAALISVLQWNNCAHLEGRQTFSLNYAA